MDMNFSAFKHNKKRNIGLLAEFFSKYIAQAFVEKRHSDVIRAREVWNKYVHEGSEINKELKLFNLLLETNLNHKESALVLLKRVAKDCKKQNQKILDEQKEAMILEISKTLNDSKFFDKPIKDYKTYATVQVLLNAWRGTGVKGSHSDIIQLEESVLENIITTKQKPVLTENLFSQLTNEQVDTFVEKIMQKKLNEKYEHLTNEQKELIRLYVFSKDTTENLSKLKERLRTIKKETLLLSENYLNSEGKTEKVVSNKIKQIVELLSSSDYSNESNINEDKIAVYMNLVALKEEFKS